MLEAVGLSAAETDVYRALVGAAAASADEVSTTTGLDAGTAGRLLVALEHKGLAHGVEGVPGRFAANPPDLALRPRIERRADDLDKARTAASELMEAYRRNAWIRDASDVVEPVTGAGGLRRRLQQVQDSAREELLWFCRARYVALPSGTNRAEFDALGRGVGYRVLYEQAFFDGSGSVDNVVRAVRAGEAARAVPALPLRMAIADRCVAICPLAPAGPAGDPREETAAVVRGSSLVEALVALFERYWEIGAPLRVTAQGQIGGPGLEADADALTADDRHLLSLMVAGITDESIAGQLGISRRTVQRRIQHLMHIAGVATRMQLGWQAARRDWI
ncbi:helix-turn-helix domain-containing protein [Streptomyces marianii]|uniref:TrmB family transcriptional regulator n=1 Tax=Streptomyces marianii TaxID=1817406 RepID=A0A5R9DY95_9ACTN|nr:helix-turn-helix domain-containing protein [Streptomyces marianii]TLQ42326.1 TrmB family transcriptional regulator [Streptomyces marianii]